MKKNTIRIGFLNFQNGVNVNKGYLQYLISFWKYHLPHSIKFIKNAKKDLEKLDVLGLSEVEFGSLSTGFVNYLNYISKTINLKHKTFFPIYKISKIYNRGSAILTKHPILKIKNFELPSIGKLRSLGQIAIKINKTKVNFFITHLALNSFDRKKQIDEIARILKKIKKPSILVGDFNTHNESELLPIIHSGLKMINKYKTYPSWNPKKTIDYLFFTNHFKLKKLIKYNKKLSDHLPVIAELELKIFKTGS